MSIKTLLIANRGEIAIRIARAAAELGIHTVAVFSEDDTQALHIRKTDQAYALRGTGGSAYLDMDQILEVARAAECDTIHPGYGFLSENAEFARRCNETGLYFLGPSAEVLTLFGDKARARALAIEAGVAVVPGTSGATSLEDAQAFFRSLDQGAAVMIKALAGGGGRGMCAVERLEDMPSAFKRCQSEARAAFGSDAVYVEQFLRRPRHIEVQIVGDESGSVIHLGERECSLQRRNQKLVEVAPSPSLTLELRERLTEAAVRLAESVNYTSLGTFEFLVGGEDSFTFMEVNPRLQVEHTVTEEVTGVDLVKTQLQLSSGWSLSELGLKQDELQPTRGYAVQCRVNMETMTEKGEAQPSGGTLNAFDPPSGPGIRVDTLGYTGYTTSPSFDSLLAKVIAHDTSGSFAGAIRRAARALREFRVEGVATNIGFLEALLNRSEVLANGIHTGFVAEHMQELLASANNDARPLYFKSEEQTQTPMRDDAVTEGPENTVPTLSPAQGTVVSIDVAVDDTVHAGQQVAVIEAMKMEFVINADTAGVVRRIDAARGDTLFEGYPVLFIEPGDVVGEQDEEQREEDLDAIRDDLAEVKARHEATLDASRPDAVEKRRKTGQRTARENIEDLCDPGSFQEYGALLLAAQRGRRPLDDLIRRTPADGLIAGTGRINGQLFDDERARCMIMSYDYTVLAGTQGGMGHKKTDRILELAERHRLPLILFAEGGGGRPGDTDMKTKVAGLDTPSFARFARLSGLVPVVGIVSGRCFAGNAAMLGCSDVIIATENANIGMGGPAMIEGGGLGQFKPEDIGPVSVHGPNGVIDVLVEDETAAVHAAKQYMSYFQGPLTCWDCADQRHLRHLIPENRLRVYDIRSVIYTLADADSVLELRRQFAPGMITALIRMEGRSIGLIANDPRHLGGAIDSTAADKASRFMQLCDAFDIPMLSLCDTPGFMVGPESEKSATVRHVSRMFVTAASLDVPFFTVVLRKGYGLGAQAMAGGSFGSPTFIISWPSGEFGGMGLEGAVRLGYRKELEAVEDPAERQALYEKMVAEQYEKGKAINMASFLEIDAVIDPVDTRTWIMRSLRAIPGPARAGRDRKRPFIDTW